MGEQRPPEKEEEGNPVCQKKKQESEDDGGKQTLQLWSLGDLVAICILLLDINQSACDIHPIKPVHVIFSPLQLEPQAKTNMSKQVTKKDEKIRIKCEKNAHIYKLSKKYKLRNSESIFSHQMCNIKRH